MTERPSEVLPDVSLLRSPVAVDTETTGLFCDDGAYVTVVSVAYRLDDGIHLHAFPFDIGRPEAKGFEVRYYKAGAYKGQTRDRTGGRWDWSPEANEGQNLDRRDWYDLRLWLAESGKAVGHIYQNAKFDLTQMAVGAPHGWPGIELEEYVKWDTMLASAELWPTESTSLKPTCARIWGEEAVAESDEQREALAAVAARYGLTKADGPRYDLVPWSVLEAYAAADAALTLQLWELQVRALEEGQGSLIEIERAMRLMRVLYHIERRGIGPYDVERSRRISEAMLARIEVLVPRIAAAFGIGSPDGDGVEAITPAMAREFYFETLGLAPWIPGDVVHGSIDPKTNKPRLGSCGVDVVRRMAEAGAPGAADYAEYLALTSANRMFYAGYADLAGPDRQIRTNFRQAHVRSGRMSVERFQAQALPKHVGITLGKRAVPEPRELFGVAEGRVRVNLDLSQAELRIAAKFAGCTTMLEALETGADFHGMTTTSVFGMSPDHPEWSAYRDIAKRLTFGSIFMIGGPRFQATLAQLAGVVWPLDRCKEAVSAWRRTYPEFGDAYEYWMAVAAQHRAVELYDGTRSHFGPRDYDNTGWNRRVQGSLAKWVNTEWLPYVEGRTSQWDALVLTVHDSVVLDLPVEVADEVSADIREWTADAWYKAFGVSGGCDSSPWVK